MPEKHETPTWVADRIKAVGGLNRFGEANFRVIWGGNRYHTVGGFFKKIIQATDESGQKKAAVIEVAETRQLLAYHPERWHLERFRDVDFYGSPDEWYEQTTLKAPPWWDYSELWELDERSKILTMGPYPSCGDFEHVFYLAMCPHMTAEDSEWCALCKVSSGVYIPLEDNVHILEQFIRALLLSGDVSQADERKALFLREDEKRRANGKRVAAIVQNAMRPQLALQPTSWQDGSRCAGAELECCKKGTCKGHHPVPANRAGFRQSNHVMPAEKQRQMENYP
jgi:hypothetical protein